MEISAAGFVLQMPDVECDAVCCLIIPVYVFPSADSFYDTFHTTADMMYFCQMMAVLEVVNPLLGLVKTGFFPAMIQVIVPDFLTLQTLNNTELTTYWIVCVSLDEVIWFNLLLASVSSRHIKTKMNPNCLLWLFMYFICQLVPPSKGLATQRNLGGVLQPHDHYSAVNHLWQMLQVAGRNVILFVIFGSLEEMQNRPVVFFVFYLWSTIEVFRWAPLLPLCPVSPVCCNVCATSSSSGTPSTCWPASAQSGSR